MLLFSFIIANLQGIDWNKKKYFLLCFVSNHPTYWPLWQTTGKMQGKSTLWHGSRSPWKWQAYLIQVCRPIESKGKGRQRFITFRGWHSLPVWALDSTGDTCQQQETYSRTKLNHNTCTLYFCLSTQCLSWRLTWLFIIFIKLVKLIFSEDAWLLCLIVLTWRLFSIAIIRWHDQDNWVSN